MIGIWSVNCGNQQAVSWAVAARVPSGRDGSSDPSTTASASAPILVDSTAQMHTITDRANVGTGGDWATASSYFGTDYDRFVADSSAVTTLSPPRHLTEFHTDVVAVFDSYARASTGGQTSADDVDVETLQIARRAKVRRRDDFERRIDACYPVRQLLASAR